MVILTRVAILFVVFGVGAGLFTVPYINSLAVDIENKAEVRINKQIIIVSVIDEPEESETGLAGVASLGINEGELFTFAKPDDYGFWMKGMKIPLDIVWIQDDQIVGFEENIQPQPGVADEDLAVYYPPEPVNKVLEISAGRAKLLKAAIGDLVAVKPLVNK